MARSQPEFNLFKFNLDIERIIRVHRNTGRTFSNLNLSIENFSISFISDLIVVDIANLDRTLKELATSNVSYQSLCIQYPNIDAILN